MTVRQRLVVAGGLGSGKSTVGRLLREIGWSVIDTDQVGHGVIQDEQIVREIAGHWPEVVIDGSVDRSLLAQRVFGWPEQLHALEAIVHPTIASRVESWLADAGRRAAIEVSVLKVLRPEWGKMVVVYAPKRLRLERAVAGGMERGDASRRMDAQLAEREMLRRADLVIDNSGSERSLRASVARLDRQYP